MLALAPHSVDLTCFSPNLRCTVPVREHDGIVAPCGLQIGLDLLLPRARPWLPDCGRGTARRRYRSEPCGERYGYLFGAVARPGKKNRGASKIAHLRSQGHSWRKSRRKQESAKNCTADCFWPAPKHMNCVWGPL
jgi:hypothetical protein